MRIRPLATVVALVVTGAAAHAGAQSLINATPSVNDTGLDYIECVYIAKYDGPTVLSNREAANSCVPEARAFFAATASNSGRLPTYGLQRYPGENNGFYRRVSRELKQREFR